MSRFRAVCVPMPSFSTAARFFFQSATVGLAAAFLIVYLFPGLLPPGHPLRSAVGTEQASYADAVAATAPAVVNLVGRPTGEAGTAATAS